MICFKMKTVTLMKKNKINVDVEAMAKPQNHPVTSIKKSQLASWVSTAWLVHWWCPVIGKKQKSVAVGETVSDPAGFQAVQP